MEVDGQHGGIEELFVQEPDKWRSALTSIKISVICNNKQKSSYIDLGIIPRLLTWMSDEAIVMDLRTEAASVLGSLAKGTRLNVMSILDAGALPVLLTGVTHDNLKYAEACLRCLRTLIADSSVDAGCVYEDASLMAHLIAIMPKSPWTQECVAIIISHCSQKYEHQITLCNYGAVAALASLLASSRPQVLLPTLASLASLSLHNEQVAYTITATHHNGESIPTILSNFLAGDQKTELRLAAAKCLTNLYRCRALPTQYVRIATLPVLAHLCKDEFPLELNIEAAMTLAYLTEVSSELQLLASITDRSIASLAKFLEKSKQNVEARDGLLQAAFLAFAALSSNDEEIRKKVIDVEDLMSSAVAGVNSPNVLVQVAALKFLHCASRSVQHLRTSFHNLTTATLTSLLQLTQSANLELVLASTSLVCNLALEFSPAKATILELDGPIILMRLRSHRNAEVRLNAMWALMNMAFQAREQVKTLIMEYLTVDPDRFFKIISDPSSDVVMKTLGLLRNLLSFREHIDSLMGMYGVKIMHAIVYILEGNFTIDIKEQTLCLLVNIADGATAKEDIMANEDILKKLINYLVYSNEKLQLAATVCITNLIWNGDNGCHVRQAQLRDIGVQRMLHQLQSTTNANSPLHEKVMKALQQFSS